MRHIAFLLVLPLAACGGGGGSNPQPAPLTTQQLLEECLAADLADLSTVIATVQGILSSGGTGPQPQFDLVTAVLTGVLPWTVDLDGDQAKDLSGTVFLTDAGGAVTIPPAVLSLLGGGGSLDLNAILALLPDGTHLNLTFVFDDLALVHGASGDGDFSAEVQGGAVTSVDGGGTFTSAECDFSFDFDGLGPEILEGGGFGSGTVGFDLGVGTDAVGGSIDLDGTSVATVTATRAGGAPETFLVDLTTGAVTPR
ncbi:MAG TPA: hypothetical protein VFY93_12565 [Planctomycetota bacterium]|nr:hypothetical protein [Planctomycetota bacterium]